MSKKACSLEFLFGHKAEVGVVHGEAEVLGVLVEGHHFFLWESVHAPKERPAYGLLNIGGAVLTGLNTVKLHLVKAMVEHIYDENHRFSDW